MSACVVCMCLSVLCVWVHADNDKYICLSVSVCVCAGHQVQSVRRGPENGEREEKRRSTIARQTAVVVFIIVLDNVLRFCMSVYCCVVHVFLLSLLSPSSPSWCVCVFVCVVHTLLSSLPSLDVCVSPQCHVSHRRVCGTVILWYAFSTSLSRVYHLRHVCARLRVSPSPWFRCYHLHRYRRYVR